MMLKEMRAYFLSPALPAAGLLCGMVFFLAFSHFMSLRWQPAATITLYSVLLVWVSSLAWRERKRWGGIGGLDALFVAFILLVLASLVVQGAHTVGWKYGRYLPFLAIGPYVCGRLMRTQDVQLLSGILAFAGLVMLVLLALDYWENLTALTVYSRWHFFGYGYTPLLVGMLFASSLVVWSFPSLTGGSGSGELLSLRKAGRLLALGLVAAALVGVAARGAVLAGVVSMFSLVVIVRQWSLSRKFLLLLYLTAIMLFTYWILPAPQAQGYRSLGALSIENTLGEVLSNSSVPGLIGWVLKLPQWNWVPAHLVWEPILGKESCAPLYEGIDSLAIRILLHREAIAMFVSSPWWGGGAASFGWNSCSGEMGFPHSTLLQIVAELGIVGAILFGGLMSGTCRCFARKAVEVAATADTQAAQLALALFVIYLVADQVYGNYFLATGFYLLAGMASGMRSNPVSNDGLG